MGGKNSPTEGRVYEFDRVFDESASQEEVYKFTTAPLVRSVFQGFCATVFAYGYVSYSWLTFSVKCTFKLYSVTGIWSVTCSLWLKINMPIEKLCQYYGSVSFHHFWKANDIL